MPQTENTVFLSFDRGLDLYTNPHRLNPNVLSVAVGVAVDRPGYAYPGPGYSPVISGLPSFDSYISAFAYNGLAQGQADAAVFWGIQTGQTVPSFVSYSPASGSSEVLASLPVYPFRQQQIRLLPSTGNFFTSTLSGQNVAVAPQIGCSPQTATQGQYRVTAWLEAAAVGSTCVATVTDLSTGVSSLPHSNLDQGTLSTTGSATPGNALWGICADSQYVYLAAYNVGSNTLALYYFTVGQTAGQDLDLMLSHSTSVSPTSGTMLGVYLTGQASTGSGEPDASAVAWVTSTHLLQAAVLAGTPTPAKVTLVATGVQLPFSFSVGLVLSGLNNDTLTAGNYLATYAVTNILGKIDPWVLRANLALGAITTQIVTNQSQDPAIRAWTQFSVSFVDGGNDTYSWVGSLVDGASQAHGGLHFSYVNFSSAKFSNGSVLSHNSTTAWGGLTLAGRSRLMQFRVSPSPRNLGQAVSSLMVFIPTRSGWRAADGAWGTIHTAGAVPAYPTGFLYDMFGNLVAKFGDSDIGSNDFFPSFDGAQGPTLQPILTEASVILPTGTMAGSLSYCFPQFYEFTSIAAFTSGSTTALRADVGAIIGATPQPAIVTWTDANYLSPPAPAVQQGSTVTFPGALTAHFDGASVFEAGWLTASPTPQVIAFPISGSSFPNGYSAEYLAVAVFRDNNGELYRAAPSFVCTSPAITNSPSSQGFIITVSQLFQTLKHGTNLPVEIEIYRNVPTLANNQNFYRIPGIVVSNGNLSTGVYCPVLLDTTLDADLIANLQLYTSGFQTGAAEGTNNPLPFDCLAVWNNSTWGIARRNGFFELWFTWAQDNNLLRSEGPTWNTNNRLPLPSFIGQPRAIIPLDTQLVILGSLADCVVTGPGPSRSLTYADDSTVYTVPTALPGSGGIRALNAAALTPQGIIFQGQQGFVLLDRGLSYTPTVGNPVRPLSDAYRYLPGVYVPEMQGILFFAATPTPPINGDILEAYPDVMYFYNTQQWSQVERPLSGPFPPLQPPWAVLGPIVAAAKVGNADGTVTWYLVTTSGVVLMLNRYSQFVQWRTGWVENTAYTVSGMGTLANVRQQSNYGTIREVQVLLDCLDPTADVKAVLTLTAEFDYEDNTATPPQTQTLNVHTMTGDTTFRFGLNASQCRRVRFTVTIDYQPGQTNGAVPLFLITGLEVSYATDQGLSRLGTPNSSNF